MANACLPNKAATPKADSSPTKLWNKSKAFILEFVICSCSAISSAAFFFLSSIALSAITFFFSSFTIESSAPFFSSSICSFNNEFVFINCSLLKPSTCACIAILSFLASIKAIWFSMLSFKANSLAAAVIDNSAFSSIVFSCSSKISPSFILAAILSSIDLLSSSRICLCCSACLSYFSINPWLIASAIKACLATTVIPDAALYDSFA